MNELNFLSKFGNLVKKKQITKFIASKMKSFKAAKFRAIKICHFFFEMKKKPNTTTESNNPIFIKTMNLKCLKYTFLCFARNAKLPSAFSVT